LWCRREVQNGRSLEFTNAFRSPRHLIRHSGIKNLKGSHAHAVLLLSHISASAYFHAVRSRATGPLPRSKPRPPSLVYEQELSSSTRFRPLISLVSSEMEVTPLEIQIQIAIWPKAHITCGRTVTRRVVLTASTTRIHPQYARPNHLCAPFFVSSSRRIP